MRSTRMSIPCYVYLMRVALACRCKGSALLLAFAALLLPFGTNAYNRPEMVMKCFDDQDCLSQRTYWTNFVNDIPSCLVAKKIWWSQKPAGMPVTLVTQLSGGRINQLRAQCNSWRGPLAAVVYLPLYNTFAGGLTKENGHAVQSAMDRIEVLFRSSNANTTTGCQLRVLLLYELFADPRAAMLFYPVNTLRNYARLMADTDLIANIDVDLIPSASFSAAMADPRVIAEYAAKCRDNRGAFVIPAFTLACGDEVLADNLAATAGKAEIRANLDKCVRVFAYKKPVFHAPTQFSRWLDSKDAPYPIRYELNFEPWYMSWRWLTPWYDYRYRGYGNNKIVQVADMNTTGAHWYVSPHGFLIHRPHESTLMRDEFLRAKLTTHELKDLRGTMFEHVESLWLATQAEMRAGKYMARLEPAFRRCRDSLPWWRADGALGGGGGGDDAAHEQHHRQQQLTEAQRQQQQLSHLALLRQQQQEMLHGWAQDEHLEDTLEQ